MSEYMKVLNDKIRIGRKSGGPDNSKSMLVDLDVLVGIQSEISALHLALSEYKILLTASTKREGELMDGIRAHKEDCDTLKNTLFNHDEIDSELHKLLGEAE